MAMTLRLTPEQDAMLTALAERRGISKQQAALEAVDKLIADEVRHLRFVAAANNILERDAELLKRLADA